MKGEDVADAVGSPEDEHILAEAEQIAVAVGRMFPGLCEVVLHDLRRPEHAIRVIENNLSGRQVGDAATELGLARIADPEYPNVLQNYPNKFVDGRPVKSTSVGLKNSRGEYIAALCLNLDLSTLAPLMLTMTNLVATTDTEAPVETLRPRTSRDLQQAIDHFAASRSTAPRALSREAKREVVRQLHQDGYFESRGSAQAMADLLGVSRATVYNYARRGSPEPTP